jgi:hypothetical protein
MESWQRTFYKVNVNFTIEQFNELESKARFLDKRGLVYCIIKFKYNNDINKIHVAQTIYSQIKKGESRFPKWLVEDIEKEFINKLKNENL